jgi:glycosyltransferase involved in cell wall biosynthesis
MTISAVVIAHNEESNIARCLNSLTWADEIVVIDSNSNDRTAEIARSLGAKVTTRPWNGFGPTKQAACNLAASDWILSIDADEVVSPVLAGLIRQKIDTAPDVAGYYIKRRTLFMGRWIQYCGWYPDRVLRLFRKDSGRFDNAIVHERVILEGLSANIEEDILHYSYPDLETYMAKFGRYMALGAEELYTKGRRARLIDLTLRPVASFIKHYIARQGFRDGIPGLVVSTMSSVAVFVKYSKLWEMQKGGANR